MIAITFDTLKYANTLKAAGIKPDQAEAQAKALADVLEVNLKDLATKGDLESGLRELELRMTIKLGAMLVVVVGVIAALIKL